MTVINGTTKLVGLIGNNIHFSKSFCMHNSAFSELGINARYIPLRMCKSSIHHALTALKTFQFLGANVTMPFKEAVIPYLDSLSTEAERIGAVNTLYCQNGKIIGDNTDTVGFISSLQEAAIQHLNRPVFIYGAGGSARAISYALAKAGTKEMYIANRNKDRLKNVLSMIRNNFKDVTVKVFDRVDKPDALIVNCTPVGSAGLDQQMLWPKNKLFLPSQTVVDIVYEPSETLLLRKAKHDGAETLNGLSMLLHQAVYSFSLWTNVNAPIYKMRQALLDN